ncbi:MAG: hypothetical protein E7566_03260 [Ruminococcaceae bacterium]|nr:hypothetical protein [Oscillospiraceae bacterium]
MKYCSSCKSIIKEDTDKCSVCKRTVEKIYDEATVTVAEVKGVSISVLEPALKDVGIPCRFEKRDGSVYNDYNVKVSAESNFKVLVPFEMYNKAFDVCEGFGFVNEEDRLVSNDENEDTDNRSYNEKFEAGTGVKHRTWQMAGIVAFVIIACLVIWGVDFVAQWIKELLS